MLPCLWVPLFSVPSQPSSGVEFPSGPSNGLLTTTSALGEFGAVSSPPPVTLVPGGQETFFVPCPPGLMFLLASGYLKLPFAQIAVVVICASDPDVLLASPSHADAPLGKAGTVVATESSKSLLSPVRLKPPPVTCGWPAGQVAVPGLPLWPVGRVLVTVLVVEMYLSSLARAFG